MVPILDFINSGVSIYLGTGADFYLDNNQFNEVCKNKVLRTTMSEKGRELISNSGAKNFYNEFLSNII